MKKTIACICILFGVLGVRADVRTNYVYVVSNIFNNVYTESIVTQKVKSSHTDFYYTNYVSVVTNVYQTTFRTNVSVNVDVSQTYVNAAANAASNALSFASQSAASASAAGSSASSASSAASRAAASAASASSAASDGLQRINERINWFDLHSGETITQVNINTNFYLPNHIIDRGNYVVDLSTMSMSVAGGKNIKLCAYANWSSFNYPVIDGIVFKNASNVGGLTVHYGDPSLDVSANKTIAHLFIDDLYWSNDGYWNLEVHWYHNKISSAYGKGTYRGAGPAFPPNKHNPNAQFVEGQITLTLVSQDVSSSTYRSYLGNNFYLWRASDDTSTSDILPVISFVTDEDLRLSINSLSNWVETVFQKR